MQASRDTQSKPLENSRASPCGPRTSFRRFPQQDSGDTQTKTRGIHEVRLRWILVKSSGDFQSKPLETPRTSFLKTSSYILWRVPEQLSKDLQSSHVRASLTSLWRLPESIWGLPEKAFENSHDKSLEISSTGFSELPEQASGYSHRKPLKTPRANVWGLSGQIYGNFQSNKLRTSMTNL